MTDSPPTTTNPTATTVNQTINDIVGIAEQTAITAAETALDTAAPIFALPVIKQASDLAIEEIVKYVGNDVNISLQNIGTFIVIDTQVAGEESGISQALAALMVAEKSGDPNAIKQAIQNYANAQSALTHDDGSAPPQS